MICHRSEREIPLFNEKWCFFKADLPITGFGFPLVTLGAPLQELVSAERIESELPLKPQFWCLQGGRYRGIRHESHVLLS
jgi:hypothetical protein